MGLWRPWEIDHLSCGWLKTIPISLVATAAAAMAAAADFHDSGGLTLSAGGEYQVISQEYYRLVFDTISTDIIESWYLDTDAINDFIFKTGLGYRHRSPGNRFDGIVDIEFSGDRFLGRADGICRVGSNDHNFKIAGLVEAKAPFEGDEEWVEGYTYLSGYLRTDHAVKSRAELFARIAYDVMLFSESDTTVNRSDTTFSNINIYPNYDYSLLSGSVGGKLLFREFGNELGWEVRYRHRTVPDSSLADYDQLRFGLDYSLIGIDGYLNIFGGVEVKDYLRSADEDDFVAWELNALATRRLDERLEGFFTLFLDVYDFDRSDIINRDYWYILGELKGLYGLGSVQAGPLVRLEIRRSEELDEPAQELISNDYDQWEAGISAELLQSRKLYFLAEVTLGRRHYLRENDILTDFSFFSPSIIATWEFSRYFSVELLFDGTFERHRETTDNSNLYLLSIGLSARI